MDVKVTSDLRLALPVAWAEKPAQGDNEPETVPTVWGYHTPITREVFEANWRIISAASATLLKKGVSPSIVRVATLALKDAGRQDALEYGLPEGLKIEDGGTAAALCREIKRLTVILAPGPVQYEMMPVEVAVSRGIISDEDWSEAEASLVFFTCGYSLAVRQKKRASADALASVLSGSITSLAPTEFASSLSASMPPKTFDPVPMAGQSLVPS